MQSKVHRQEAQTCWPMSGSGRCIRWRLSRCMNRSSLTPSTVTGQFPPNVRLRRWGACERSRLMTVSLTPAVCTGQSGLILLQHCRRSNMPRQFHSATRTRARTRACAATDDAMLAGSQPQVLFTVQPSRCKRRQTQAHTYATSLQHTTNSAL